MRASLTQNGCPVALVGEAPLASFGASQVMSAKDIKVVRSILAVLAIAKGVRSYGSLILNYSEDELLEMQFRE